MAAGCLSFSCNDYLNLTQHPAIKTGRHRRDRANIGAGSGASRLVTGNHPLYAKLEARLAEFKRTEAACVFGSGYLANTGIIPALIGSDGLVLLDEFSHACIYAGAQLSRGQVKTFRHNDVGHARALLDAHRTQHDRALIVTDGVFSMDGDIAPLEDLLSLAGQYDAWLMSDDAHGIGVRRRRTRIELFGEFAHCRSAADGNAVEGDRLLWRLSLCVSARHRSDAQPRTHADLFDRLAAGERRRRDRRARPDRAGAGLRGAAGRTRRRRSPAARDLPEAQSPIVPIVIGDEEAALSASRTLEDEGFLVVAIRPPTVPAGTARLRFTFTAQHPDDEIARLADIVRDRLSA